jgi:preprotein translocase subunit SecG
MMGFLFYTTIAIFIFVCFCMILLILIQKGRGGGLASAFGGAGGNTAFGSKTGDVLTWATSVVFGVFILLAVALNLFADARNRAAQAPQASATVNSPPLEVPIGPEPSAPVPTTLPAATPSTAPATVPSTSPAADATAKPQAATAPASTAPAQQAPPASNPEPGAK